MNSFRVILALLALAALPFVAVAQGQSADNKCKAMPSTARAQGLDAAPGQAKRCSDPSPTPEPPPSGIHAATGTVYEDVDGSGTQEMLAGEFGLSGWTVQLFWNGQLVTSGTTDIEGKYFFPNLGAGDLWAVCVSPQAGYSRTQPVSGDACDGNGVTFIMPNNTFGTWAQNNFGWMLQ